MRRLNQNELNSAYRIFRNVDMLIGKYYGRKTEHQIRNYISANRWIMFPDKGITSLRDAVSLPFPNVYVSFESDDITDNDRGQVDGNIGFTYHNKEAMKWLHQILRLKSKSVQFMEILKGFNDNWVVGIWHKTRVDFHESIPRYSEFQTMKPSTTKVETIQRAIEDSDNSLFYPGDFHPDDGHIIKSDITVFTIYKDTTEDVFDKDIKKVFGLFLKALNLKL